MRIMTNIKGVEPWAQGCVRPLSLCFGSSYKINPKTAVHEKFEPSLLEKIVVIALTILFLPLAFPLVIGGCLRLIYSDEHRKRYTFIQHLAEHQEAEPKIKENLTRLTKSLQEITETFLDNKDLLGKIKDLKYKILVCKELTRFDLYSARKYIVKIDSALGCLADKICYLVLPSTFLALQANRLALQAYII